MRTSVEAHSLWAETYDRTPNPLLALEERIVGPLLPPLQGMVTLDVACGTGRWLSHMLHRGAALGGGFDLSPEMLQQAQRKAFLQGRLIQGDCEAIPLGNNSVDLAMCSFAVTYLPDLRLFAQELSRIVKERGHLFVCDFHPSAHLRGWKRSFRHNEMTVEISSFHYSIDEIFLSLASEGFELVSRIEPSFGEPERDICEAYGKSHLLDQGSAPAIFVCYFRRGRKTKKLLS